MTTVRLVAKAGESIEGSINSFSIRTVLISSVLLILLLLISSRIVKNKKLSNLKKPLFIMIAATIILPSLLMTGSTIYLNTISDSKGPVHWHTDIEFWACGQEIELRDPYEFLSNKIGTSTYHEHDDKRIHLEGVVVDKEHDASLEHFMEVIGGSIDETTLTIPVNDDQIIEDDIDGDAPTNTDELPAQASATDSEGRRTLSFKNGIGACGSQGYAEVQAFLFRFNKEDDTYAQTKLDEPALYTMRDESTVPPGDCLIVEFDTVKSQTDRLCQQYGLRDSIRCVEFGVSEFNPKLCNLKETAEPKEDR